MFGKYNGFVSKLKARRVSAFMYFLVYRPDHSLG
jgi:hypothetical protein